MSGYMISHYKTEEWFQSLAWQHQWIEYMVGWWAGEFGVPKKVLDLGAGDGWWAKAFHGLGSSAWAVELYEEAREFIPEQVQFIQHDLREPVDLHSQADLVICLEVAEHLPKQASGILVQTICRHASNHVLFSSAPPGQPGTGHINLQQPKFWRDIFDGHKFGLNAGMTGKTREAFERIVNETFEFLPRNIQIFSRI
jgi:2-polyprenyl-3-methyl-5-hydroxy-6-metoxy-1,4-benzoquinol methylase